MFDCGLDIDDEICFGPDIDYDDIDDDDDDE